MFWAAEIIISTKKITLIDYQKQKFILILVQLIIVKFYYFFVSLRFFGVLDCSYITFMIVLIVNKNIIMKYITHYYISLNCKKKKLIKLNND